MAMIKVGTKAKVVIGIINTHFSIYPSNEAFLFIPSKRFIRKNSIQAEPAGVISTPRICLYYPGGTTKDVNNCTRTVQSQRTSPSEDVLCGGGTDV